MIKYPKVLSSLAVVAAIGCSSFHRVDQRIPFNPSSRFIEPHLLWSHSSLGPVTDLKMARGSGDVFYSEIPDPDFPRSPSSPRLVRVSSEGVVQWAKPLSSKVKEFDVSDTGDRVVVTTYDEKVTVYDGQGRVAWALQTFCHPIVLTQAKRIICFFDDDSNPMTAFSVYDWNGKKMFEQSTSKEVLSIAVSPDHSVIAFTTTGGWITAINNDGKLLQKRRVEGEWVNLTVEADRGRWVSATGIVQTSRGQRLMQVRPDAMLSTALEYRVDRILQTGRDIFVFGNTMQGQIYAQVRSKDDATLQHVWSVREPKFSDFSVPVVTWAHGWIAGFEAGQSMVLLGLDDTGGMRWNIPVKTQEGAYVYDGAGDRVVVSTDLGQMGYYRLSRRGGE